MLYPFFHNHGSGKWVPGRWLACLLLGAIFHFDYGRKGNHFTVGPSWPPRCPKWSHWWRGAPSEAATKPSFNIRNTSPVDPNLIEISAWNCCNATRNHQFFTPCLPVGSETSHPHQWPVVLPNAGPHAPELLTTRLYERKERNRHQPPLNLPGFHRLSHDAICVGVVRIPMMISNII